MWRHVHPTETRDRRGIRKGVKRLVGVKSAKIYEDCVCKLLKKAQSEDTTECFIAPEILKNKYLKYTTSPQKKTETEVYK